MHFNAGHSRKFLQLCSVGRGTGQYSVARSSVRVASFPASKNQAGRKPTQVPFPRGTNGFIKVVDIEYQPAIGGGIRAQVAHVSVTANLNRNSGAGQGRQIGRHHSDIPTEEPKRGDRHSSHLDGDQFSNAFLIDLKNDFNGIVATLAAVPVSMIRAPKFAA
jgi:hypothetical protein